jgi:methyltransferase family protein
MWSKMLLRALRLVTKPFRPGVFHGRIGVVPDNFLERVALHSGLLAPGIFECWFGIMLARTVMAATKLDIFESLAAGPLTAEDVAERCGTHPRATEKLLNALVGVGCLRVLGERYNLPQSAGPGFSKMARIRSATRTCCATWSGTGGNTARNTSVRVGLCACTTR